MFGRLRHLATLPAALPIALLVFAYLELALAEDLEHKSIALVFAPLIILPLAWRRSHPLPAALTSAGMFLVQGLLGVPPNGQVVTTIAMIAAGFAVGRHAPPAQARIGFAALLALGFAAELISGAAAGDYVFVGALLAASWLAGAALAARAHQTDQIAHRAALVEATAEDRAQEAVELERRRIARELHDVVAHAITVMVLQAGAAEAVVKADPERAEEPLRTIQEVGRSALVDMKHLLGVLRASDQDDALAPQPDLGDLDSLVAQLGAAGLPVSLETEGDLDTCPAGVGTSAYRIVREALTNTLRHAGPTRAQVRVRREDAALRIEVLDDGTAVAGGDPGFGFMGMRERVAAFGGEFSAGERPEGGFAVRASFPIAQAAR
ncbi:MAG TPA: sensor histidine kinase [Acidimicrobiales bacterium]|nr:sensor histidine kinase [Acidimicrobiales bacterium]